METLKEILILYLLLLDIITDSSNMFFAKTNETINLDTIMVCDKWMKDNEPQPKTFAVLRENIGYYYCSSSKTNIFIFTVDKDMTFEIMPVQQSFIVGDNVTLSCYVTFQTTLHMIETQTTINDSNKYINAANDSVYNRKYEKEAEAVIEFDTNGTKSYFCTWSFNVKDSPHKGEVIKSISFRVYMPPTNVRPDSTKAQVNVTRIICHSDADPPPSKYSWNCVNGSSWSSNESSIIFHEIGIYSCICSVENNINGRVYRSHWNGTIDVVSKEDFDLNTSPHLSASSITGIVLGTLAALALVAVVAGVLLWKFKKGCRQALRKTDKNKVEAGKEPLETIENPVYGQL